MPKHRFTILSMMKDEGHCLLEWVAYHHLIGFDNICVYTNNCQDGTDDMLIRLQEMGYCQHFRNEVPKGKKPQPHALWLAGKNPEICGSDWVLTMDADEFVNIKLGDGTVQELVDAMPDGTEGIMITWRFYGSNNILDWRPGLVTESYTHGAPDRFRKGWGVKSMVRPFPDMKFGIHRPSIKHKASKEGQVEKLLALKWMNGGGKPMTESFKKSGWRSTGPTLSYDFVELNHYAVKSYEAYLLRRLRGNVNNKEDKYNASYFSIFDRNEQEPNVSAARHAPKVKALMAEMLKDSKLATLQDKALAYHAARVDQLRHTGEYDEWVESLREAGAVRIDQLDEVLFTQHLPKDTQELVRKMQADGVPNKTIAKMIARSTGIRNAEKRQDATDAEELAKMTGVDLETGERQDKQPEPEQPPAANLAPETRARLIALIQKARKTGDVIDESGAAISEPEPVAMPDDKPAAPAIRPKLSQPFPGNGRKVVLSTMKNEGPYLLEWIAHYRNLGFDDFVLFSNDCTDGTNLLLNRLDAMGIVHHYDNPLGPRMDPQRRAYSRANQMDVVRDASWVLIADADEFLNVHVGDGTVDALLDACPDSTEAISINWRLFGSGGQRHMMPEPVTRRFTRACRVEDPESGLVWGFKTLFRPASFDYFGVHRPRFEKKVEIHPDQVNWVNARGEPMGEKYLRGGWRSNKNIVAYDFAQMNHYAIKSREEFLLKRLRGTANSKDKSRIDLGYWDKFDLNSCEDASIRSGDLQGRMDEMLQDGDLAALHRATLDSALRTIEMQLEDPELREFVEGDSLAEVAAQ
ncbi:glycosyltransferase family 2 protein [Nioella sp. MMSF_3534]|uniref:glycosyltransferase family 2 protein n=1 Tax=Nioella sp. MMSF_3534 TaxID=3046720 RepID=UPI00273F3A74|nr:glycosyltransferase family 2 protein [Nioella sp. MMSF_3534]